MLGRPVIWISSKHIAKSYWDISRLLKNTSKKGHTNTPIIPHHNVANPWRYRWYLWSAATQHLKPRRGQLIDVGKGWKRISSSRNPPAHGIVRCLASLGWLVYLRFKNARVWWGYDEVWSYSRFRCQSNEQQIGVALVVVAFSSVSISSVSQHLIKTSTLPVHHPQAPRPCLSDTSLHAVTIFVHQFALVSVQKGTKERKENTQGIKGSDPRSEPRCPTSAPMGREHESSMVQRYPEPGFPKVPEIL